jgi:hypothetical protein
MILAEKSTLRMRGLEHFQAKWIPVRVKKMRYNNDLEVLSDSAESETALEPSEPLPLVFAATSNRLAPDVPLSPLTPLSARSQWNLGLPSAHPSRRRLRLLLRMREALLKHALTLLFWPLRDKRKAWRSKHHTTRASPIPNTATLVAWPAIAATKAPGSWSRRSKVP